MAKFRFGLERVLEQRVREERERQKAVAELEAQRVQLEGRIREHQSAIARTKSELRSALVGERLGVAPPGVPAEPGPAGSPRVDVREVRMQAGASLGLVMKTQQLALALAGLHRRLDVARLELLRAATARKAVELLREKQYERWRREQNKRETDALDELATTRARPAGAGEDDAWCAA